MANSMLRIMFDTNVLISATFNPSTAPAKSIRLAGTNCRIVLCDYVIEECREVLKRKFPRNLELFEVLLNESNIEIFRGNAPYSFPVPDSKDQPILDAAIAADVDVLISGDKHFTELDIKQPVICTPAQFLERVEK